MKDLTPGQMQVLRLTAEGKTFKEIGAQLFYSPESINSKSVKIRRNLGAINLTHAVHIGHQRGLL